MNRILIVEDNKTLAKLMAKKISSELNIEVDVAFKLSEAKLFLKMYKYFLVLVDLNLPDAPNGESVDYILGKGAHVIVLSGNIDKEFREKILKKNIIDYISKSGVNDINYIINTISRLQKNQTHKILVVDDSMVFRKYMKEMLENLFYKVITVAHGEEALGILSSNPDISLVLTDYNMPVMDGLELTIEIRKNHSKNELAIIAMSSNEREEVNALFLKQGVNDYIKKPFSKEEFSCRVNNTIEALENINFITNQTNRDSLTGLYNRRYFLNSLQNIVDSATGVAVAMISIDNFEKLLNTLEKQSIDKIIITLSEILRTSTDYRDNVIKFDEDEFCIILKNKNLSNAAEVLANIIFEVAKATITSINDENIKFTISAGLAMHDNDNLQEALSQADMMLHNAKQNGGNKVLFE